ncbi:DUF5686 and carboxypeptidase-like regulatory domain-containing protein [Chitinophaga defluvii]|uniref:DUF5686 family protein n=1 Tax=Chitinophaga defluvii TaxID=3163343 RepID=A0ABV2T262_9BACT
MTDVLCIKRFTLLLFLAFTYSICISAQQQTISGSVKDAQTGEYLPFANVYFKGTSHGVRTNEDGQFSLTLHSLPGDSLTASVMGYNMMVMRLNRQAARQTVNFELERGIRIKEFVVNAGINPALIILRKVIQRKPVNDMHALDNYSLKAYNKVEIDLKHIQERHLQRNRLLKPFAFIAKNIDSTSEDKPFLPIFLTESLSSFYYQQSPSRQKEVIHAQQTSGIKTDAIQQYLGSMYQKLNIYDNYIQLFSKQFVSPISNSGTFYYHYKMLDTQYIRGKKCYLISFVPRRPEELVFKGEFWVHDSTFAIQKMSLYADKDANINFINKVSVVQEFAPLNDSAWFIIKDILVADFTVLGKKSVNVIGRRSLLYDSIRVNRPEVTAYFNNNGNPDAVEVALYNASTARSFWDSIRPVSLSKNERAIYAMVDTLQQLPLFKTYTNTLKFVFTGKKEFGPIEIGPVYRMISMNQLEKQRVRIDLGTTPRFNPMLRLRGHLAYGVADQELKGHVSALWILSRYPRKALYASYTHELDNGGISRGEHEEIGTDNVFTLLLRKPGIKQKFILLDEKRADYFTEWRNGFSIHIKGVNQAFYPYAPLPAVDSIVKGRITGQSNNITTELGIKLRYAPGEKFLQGRFDRISLGSKYPALTLEYDAGIKGVLGSSYHYHKLEATIAGKHVKIAPLGKLTYEVYAGKIFNPLPYFLLENHPGNEIYYYSGRAFNMMNRFEFISDEYAGFNLEHHLEGGLFNYIPLLKKMKLRQFWTAKGVIGSLSPENTAMNMHTSYRFRTLEAHPYIEVGTGIDNILRFFRVDFVWRLAPKPLPQEAYHRRFGIFGSFRLNF